MTIKIALDWTPNTIHTGLFVAVEKGLYAAQGLDVQLLPPDSAYSQSPAKRLESGEVDLAICPSESCIAYQESGKVDLQAIYAILQKDASAIVSAKPTLSKAAALQDANYGSYNARYEDHIVRALVTADGGNGKAMRIEKNTGKLSLFDELKKREQSTVDATWIFLPWEGVEAEMEGIKLNIFKTEDFGIPYGYSPVIARQAGDKSSNLTVDDLKKFARVTAEGYQFAANHPTEAVEILQPHCVPSRKLDFLTRSQETINQFYSDGTPFGSMQEQKWSKWLQWLTGQGLLREDAIDLEQTEECSSFHMSSVLQHPSTLEK